MCKLIASLITICICAQTFPSPEDYRVKKDGDKDKRKEVIIRKNDDVERVRRYMLNCHQEFSILWSDLVVLFSERWILAEMAGYRPV